MTNASGNPLRFFDTHTHLLPGMDDGSSSPDESLHMLETMNAQGVEKVCLTSHYYPWREPVSEYLARRAEAYEELKPQLEQAEMPALLGAEVRLSPELFNLGSIDDLCLEDSRLLLLELPFREAVDDRRIEQIDRFASQFYVQPVIAHFNRYDLFKNEARREELRQIGCYLQMNLEAFLGGFIDKHRALKLLRHGEIDMLGSDSHNMTSRPPNIRRAVETFKDDPELVSEFQAIFEKTTDLLGV